MQTPGLRPPRPNDEAELTRFKEEIPLVPLATSRYGYEVTDKARNDSWFKLERGPEVLIVSQKDGHDLFVNPRDTKDSGSVVDFVKSRDNLNLGQTRQQLRSYLGEGGPEQDRSTYAAKPAPLPQVRQEVRGPDANLPDDPKERRDELLRRGLGVQPVLTDRTFLRDRGLSDETIGAPAFQGRVFTSQNGPHKNTVFPLINEAGYASYEEKNHNFKSMMPGAKDGVWVSKPTAGKDTPVERVVIGESAIDQMSKYQLEQAGGKGPNTLYIATSGTVTQRQVELIQKIIDKQQPREVALASDNDNAGRRFNINYLNDLRAPRPSVELSEQQTEVPTQARAGIHWHATRAGDYHSDLKVTFDHEKAFQGRQAVAGLQEKVDGWQQENGQDTARLNVLRTGSEQTVVRLTVTNDQVPQLLLLSQDLHAQREALLPQAQRTPATFLVIEPARLKDYNLDLTEQIKDQQLASAREKAGFTAGPSEAPREAVPVRAAEPVEVRAVAVNAIEKYLTVDVRELCQRERGGGVAQAIEDDMRRAGLSIARVEQQLGNPETGERSTQIQALYLSTQPAAERAAISRTLDIIGQANGVELREQPGDAEARRGALQPSPRQSEPLPEQQLEGAKKSFAQATGELAAGLKENGYELQGQRLQETARQLQQYPNALPLRGENRENVTEALEVAGRIPALMEKGLPGPAIIGLLQANQAVEEKYQVVNDMGGPGGVRACIVVLDERQSGDNRAVQLWKDVKGEGAAVGNITEQLAAPGIVQRSFPIQYAPLPGEQLNMLNQVLGAAERSPGISLDESGAARELRLQNAGPIPKGAPAQPAYGPGPEAAANWVTYAVTSPHAPGSPELREQTAALRKAGASVSPLEGQPKEASQQLVSFSIQDGRLGAISEAIKGMSQSGGNIYDVARRQDLGEVGGYNVATIRLTEAQNAARRTPDIVDDLRANGVLIREPRQLSAPAGFVREEFQVAYDSSRTPAAVQEVFAALQRSPGIEVEESQRQQRSRELQAEAERRQQQVVQEEAERQRAVVAQQERDKQQQSENDQRANDPAEQRRRAEEDKQLGRLIVGLAVAEEAGRNYPAQGWKTEVLRDRRDDELSQLLPALAAAGAQIGGTRADGQGNQAVYLSYHPGAVQESKVLEMVERYQQAYSTPAPAVAPATEVQQAPAQRELTPTTSPGPVAVEQSTPGPVRPVEEQPQRQQPGPFQTVLVSVVEQVGENQVPQRAAELRAQLAAAGATIGAGVPQELGQQLNRQDFTVSYQRSAEPAVGLVLEAAGRTPGVSLDEPLKQQQERQLMLFGSSAPLEKPGATPAGPPQGPGQWQSGVISVSESGQEAEQNRTERIRADLLAAGAIVGSGNVASQTYNVVNGHKKTNEIHYSYHTQQPQLEQVNQVLDKAAASPAVDVREQNPVKPRPELEKREGQFNQAIITIADDPGGPTGKDRTAAITGDLSKAGAIVGEAKEVNGRVEVPISYHTHTPGIQQINESLDRAAGSAGVSVQERGEDRGARLQGAQELANGQQVARQTSQSQERESER